MTPQWTAAAALGRKGGKSKSPKKQAASRRNGSIGHKKSEANRRKEFEAYTWENSPFIAKDFAKRNDVGEYCDPAIQKAWLVWPVM